MCGLGLRNHLSAVNNTTITAMMAITTSAISNSSSISLLLAVSYYVGFVGMQVVNGSRESTRDKGYILIMGMGILASTSYIVTVSQSPLSVKWRSLRAGDELDQPLRPDEVTKNTQEHRVSLVPSTYAYLLLRCMHTTASAGLDSMIEVPSVMDRDLVIPGCSDPS